ncbi:MAG: hypothetical protein Q9207_002999 [Kuettlingeria erythrocarpa]
MAAARERTSPTKPVFTGHTAELFVQPPASDRHGQKTFHLASSVDLDHLFIVHRDRRKNKDARETVQTHVVPKAWTSSLIHPNLVDTD